jgi:hypothetical protein
MLAKAGPLRHLGTKAGSPLSSVDENADVPVSATWRAEPSDRSGIGSVSPISALSSAQGVPPLNSEASADVYFGAHPGLKSDIAHGPKSANGEVV